MPLLPPIDNDDMVIWGIIPDIAAVSLAMLSVPAKAKLKALWINPTAATNGAIVLSLFGPLGTIASLSVPSATGFGAGTRFEIPQHIRENFFEAGSGFLVTSDGGGSTGGAARVAAIFGRG